MSIIFSIFATGYILGTTAELYLTNKRLEAQLWQK